MSCWGASGIFSRVLLGIAVLRKRKGLVGGVGENGWCSSSGEDTVSFLGERSNSILYDVLLLCCVGSGYRHSNVLVIKRVVV